MAGRQHPAGFVAWVSFTLLFGLCGLLYGYLQTEHFATAEYRAWFIPKDVTDLRVFSARATCTTRLTWAECLPFLLPGRSMLWSEPGRKMWPRKLRCSANK